MITKNGLCYLWAACCVVAAGCSGESSAFFTVKGELKNAKGRTVYLAQLPFQTSQRVVIDSTIIRDSTGKFSLRTRQGDEGIYQLAVKDGPGFLLINDVHNISLTADVNQPSTYEASGSPATRHVINLYRNLLPLYNSKRRADSLVAQTTGPIDSGYMRRAEAGLQAGKVLTNYLQKWIGEQKNGTATFLGLMAARNMVPAATYSLLYEQSAERFPGHAGIARLKATQQNPVEKGTALLNTRLAAFSLPDSAGRWIGTQQFSGRWLLIDFWASWCEPCRKESPLLRELYAQYNRRGLSFLSVSIDKEPNAWANAIATDSLRWAHVREARGWDSPLLENMQIQSIPFNLLVDPKGVVRMVNVHGDSLRNTLQRFFP